MKKEIKIGEAGIIDDEFTTTLESIKSTADPANDVRDVTIRTPAHIPDHVVQQAWQLGMGTVQRLGMGLMVIAFPTMKKMPDGKPVPTIGKAEMIIAKPEDVQRILELVNVINTVNQQIAEAATMPSKLLSATLEGKRAKDEALRQLKQAANGEIPLVTASRAPTKRGMKVAGQ